MDIPGWLEGTADRAPPDASSDDHIDRHFWEEQSGRLGRQYRYKRKRASSDSSFIAPAQDRQHGLASHRAASADNAHVRARSRSSAGSSRADDRPTNLDVDKYARPPRHKTRPDRYERKTKAHKRGNEGRHEREKKPKRRKPTDDGSRTTGLVQSFQVKNGPKNNRLTLRADSNAGLFKHGRASPQVTGRGGGLPDLAFNELRFLQKPDEHQDRPHISDPAKATKQHERRKTRDEEISAYFSASKVPAGRNEPADRRRQQSERQERPRQEAANDHRSSGQQHPNIELPDKPFLGFGSKGARPDPVQKDHDAATYLTWSESARHATPEPRQPGSAQPRAAVEERPVTQASSSNGPRPNARRQSGVDGADGSNANPFRAKHNRVGRGESGECLPSRHLKGPAMIEVYQAPQDVRSSSPLVKMSPLRTTSQSLPRPHHTVFHGSRQDCSSIANRSTHGDYRTSDVLKLREDLQKPTHFEAVQDYQQAKLGDRGKENVDPESSLSVDRMLAHVRTTLAKPLNMQNPGSALSDHHSIGGRPNWLHDGHAALSRAGMPTFEQQDSHGMSPAFSKPLPSRSLLAGVSRTGSLPQRTMRPFTAESQNPGKRTSTRGPSKMLDNPQHAVSPYIQGRSIYVDQQQDSGASGSAAPFHRPVILEEEEVDSHARTQPEVLYKPLLSPEVWGDVLGSTRYSGYVGRLFPLRDGSEKLLSEPISFAGQYSEHQPWRETLQDAMFSGSDGVVGNGFWRPNKLY